MKVVTQEVSSLSVSLNNIIAASYTGTLYKVIESDCGEFPIGTFVLKGCEESGMGMVFSLKDNTPYTEKVGKDIEDWGSVKLLKMPKGFQLTLEQE